MKKDVAASTPPVIAYECQVNDVSPLSQGTFQIELLAPSGTTLNYHAGQHLQLELDLDGTGELTPLLYSIANGFNPENPRRLQLIIQNTSEFSAKILNHLSELNNRNTPVKVTMPKGEAYLQTDLDLPHLLVAAGSGIAKIKCITEHILRQQPDATVYIYWSNKHIDDFYLLDAFQDWANQNDNFNFTPIMESAAADWSGRTGYLYQVIEQDFKDLEGTQTYLCGSPDMVYGTIDQLKTKGLKESDCYSDVFAYAPREQKIT
jgi:CDP-4-dehydro-6-deoxyglucose reductase